MKITVKKQVEQETDIYLELPAFYKDKYGDAHSMIKEDGNIICVRATMVHMTPKGDSKYYVNDLTALVSEGRKITRADFDAAFSRTLTAIAAAADRLVSVSPFPEPADYRA